jgi:hypothetical protein
VLGYGMPESREPSFARELPDRFVRVHGCTPPDPRSLWRRRP